MSATYYVMAVLAGLCSLANVGVCVWAIANDKPHTFTGSACLAVILGFQCANFIERSNRRKP